MSLIFPFQVFAANSSESHAQIDIEMGILSDRSENVPLDSESCIIDILDTTNLDQSAIQAKNSPQTSDTRHASLGDLPPELILLINDWLDIKDLPQFVSTASTFYRIGNAHLNKCRWVYSQVNRFKKLSSLDKLTIDQEVDQFEQDLFYFVKSSNAWKSLYNADHTHLHLQLEPSFSKDAEDCFYVDLKMYSVASQAVTLLGMVLSRITSAPSSSEDEAAKSGNDFGFYIAICFGVNILVVCILGAFAQAKTYLHVKNLKKIQLRNDQVHEVWTQELQAFRACKVENPLLPSAAIRSLELYSLTPTNMAALIQALQDTSDFLSQNIFISTSPGAIRAIITLAQDLISKLQKDESSLTGDIPSQKLLDEVDQVLRFDLSLVR